VGMGNLEMDDENLSALGYEQDMRSGLEDEIRTECPPAGKERSLRTLLEYLPRTSKQRSTANMKERSAWN
jgi:hypothetical protein